jgi:predicted nucleic acid-binding protein
VSKIFLDTNVLVYSVDGRDPAKQAKAISLVATCLRDGNGAISTQVLQEFAAVSLTKLHHDLAVVSREVVLLESLEVVQITPPLIRRGLELCGLHQLAFWDSIILAAAEHAHCDLLWSEDFSTGARYGLLPVENPFSIP